MVGLPGTLEEARVRATATFLCGGQVDISDDLTTLPEDRWEVLEATLPPLGDAATPLDLFEPFSVSSLDYQSLCQGGDGVAAADSGEGDDVSQVWKLSVEADWDAWDLLGLFHYEGQDQAAYGAARITNFLAGADCADCHPNAHKSFAEAADTLTAAQHAASGFPLEDPHDRLGCEECHPRDLPGGFPARFPGRGADDCAACHEDPHGGQFAAGGAALGCLDCHERHAFLPHDFDAQRHAGTDFALTGAHLAAACEACHKTPPGRPQAPRAFRGTDRACAACHADAHRGAFADDGASDGGRNCSVCHSTAHFDDVDRGAFAHATLTGFALQGAHARSACEACHAHGAQPDAAGRSFGFAAAAPPGDASGCTACHADPHQGAFDQPGMPRAVGNATGCARCHDLESFAAARSRAFDHGAWTGFALSGAHRLAACTACHPSSPDPAFAHGRLGPTSVKFPGPAGACATCHEDAHGGALAAADGGAPGTDCSACHGTASFRALTQPFDHARLTGFELAGAHAPLACAACHPALRQAEPSGRRFARARGAACADCHADPHAGQFRDPGGAPQDCARCHAASGGFAPAAGFDHQRDARFALDATHRALDCAACHKSYPVPGGKPVIRYKPLGTSCKDCHGFK